MSDIRRTSTHKCDWHYYNEPDGTCDCDWECTRCGQKWHGFGGHDSQKCADLLAQRLEQSLCDTIHEDSKAQGEDRRTIDAQAAEIARLREQVRVHSLESARNYLRDYYESHSMGVNAVIQSQWARGVHSGRKECLNILDEAIDNQLQAIADTEPRP